MKVQEVMERAGTKETGRAIAYIKDALEELAMYYPTNITTERIDITENQRYYDFPQDSIKILDIRVKNHLNGDDKYRSIPRMLHTPIEEDADGV
tara:strand:+ start:724 stop:1005 length:282 start_codon:yes stop_codon:yes gene_type:complete